MNDKTKIVVLMLVVVIISAVLISFTNALTFVSLGGGRYNVTFASGNTATVSNIIYDTKSYVMNITVNTTGKGLTMKDIQEAKDYGQTINGKAKRYDKNIILIK